MKSLLKVEPTEAGVCSLGLASYWTNDELNYPVVVSNALDFSKGSNEQENTRLMNFIRKVIKGEQNVPSGFMNKETVIFIFRSWPQTYSHMY